VDSFIDPQWDSQLVSDDLLGAFSSPMGTVNAPAGVASVKANGHNAEQTDKLSQENQLLRSQLQQAKAINDEMWSRLVRDRLTSQAAAASE
jgi:pre-rRNA-processing protein IPI3